MYIVYSVYSMYSNLKIANKEVWNHGTTLSVKHFLLTFELHSSLVTATNPRSVGQLYIYTRYTLPPFQSRKNNPDSFQRQLREVSVKIIIYKPFNLFLVRFGKIESIL